MIDYRTIKDDLWDQVFEDGQYCETCPHNDEAAKECLISNLPPEERFDMCQGCEFVVQSLYRPPYKGAA